MRLTIHVIHPAPLELELRNTQHHDDLPPAAAQRLPHEHTADDASLQRLPAVLPSSLALRCSKISCRIFGNPKSIAARPVRRITSPAAPYIGLQTAIAASLIH